MLMTAEQLVSEAMTLPAGSRAWVAERLLGSLDQDEISPAWRNEIRRRVADLNAGRMGTVPMEEAFARVDAVLRKVRA